MATLEKIDVLRQLVEIFQRANASEDISGEILLLRQHCASVVDEGRLHKSAKISVRTCEFSKLQFPKSQVERSAHNVPVR